MFPLCLTKIIYLWVCSNIYTYIKNTAIMSSAEVEFPHTWEAPEVGANKDR